MFADLRGGDAKVVDRTLMMPIGHGWEAAGLPGLLAASFLAATLLPFSSEALLAAMALGPWSYTSLLLTASIGNTLGGLVNYAIGRWMPRDRLLRRAGLDEARLQRWEAAVARWGAWAALLCWLPVVGDPLALALGFFRVRPVATAVLMFIGKAARYTVILSLLRAAMG